MTTVPVRTKAACYAVHVVFNLFPVAVTLAFLNDSACRDAISIKFRLDESVFNTRRLQASTKSSVDHIFELKYADDASLYSHTPDGICREALTTCILRI